MAYPIQWGDNAALVIQLKTPEFYVLTSNFDKEGKINVNVKFENDGKNVAHGLIWNIEQIPIRYEASPEDIEKRLDEIYNDYYDVKMIGLEINDITNSTQIELDYTLFKVTSNYHLLTTTNGFSNALQLEILDIEQNVIGEMGKKALLEFDFTLSSPEFELGKKYEMNLYTHASIHDNLESFEFTDRTKKPIEAPKESEPETPTIPTTSMEEQMKLQQEKALKEYEERKKQKELDRLLELEKQITESKQQDLPETILEEKPEYIPEPIVETTINPEPIMDPEPQCGKGTEIVDGYCKVIPTKNESFWDSLFRMFSNLWG